MFPDQRAGELKQLADKGDPYAQLAFAEYMARFNGLLSTTSLQQIEVFRKRRTCTVSVC
jgi:hypothetical protein